MTKSIVETIKTFYRRISLYLWAIVLSFLCIVIVLPDILNVFIPGATDKIFSTPYIYLIIFLFFIDLIQLVASIRNKVDKIGRDIVYENQTTLLSQVLDIIGKKNIKHAMMIEVSCRTAKPILVSLIEHNCSKIEILLQHPDYATDIEQKKRIINALEEDKELWLNTPNLNVRLYKFESTIRGRLFDDHWLNMGWFAPIEKNVRIDGRLAGHINPMLLVEKGTKEGNILVKHFKKVFNTLFSDEFSISIKEYFIRYSR